MGKALKTAGAIIGGAVLMATGVGALAGMQVTAMGIAGVGTMSIANLQLMSAGLMAAGSMLDKPKSTASGSPSEWTSNPDQGIPFLFGRMGVAGKIVHRDEYGPDNRLQGIVTIYSGAGPVKSFQGFTADELPVSFESNGGTAIGKYRRQMWRSWRMGAQPDTALSLPTGLDGGAVMPMWGASYRLSGKACDLLTMQMDSKFSVYPTGEPKPMQVLEGVYGYDPRYDDTYPGGAGPCRYGVRSTYRYIDNAIIAALNWALGMIENGQVVGGIGASLQGVDLPAFVEAANIADANAWTVAAWPDTSEDASVVLDELLEAGGAKRSRVAGKISCVSRGAPRPSIVTITRRDTAGAIELDTGASRFNRLNTITPVIMSEAHKWTHAPMAPVSFAPLVTEDGGKRSDQIKYRFVSKVKQGAELAAYDILDAREPFAGTIPLLPHLRRLKPGDCFDIDEPGFMLDGVKMLVLSRSYDARTGEVRIAFRSETDSKHPLALGKTTTMPEYPGLTVPDPTEVTGPLPGDWTIVPRPPGEGGVQVPIIDIIGEVSNGTATAVHFEWWVVPFGVDPNVPPPADAEWLSAGIWPPTVTSIPVQADPGAVIWIAASYLRGENFSERRPYGPITVPVLVSEDTVNVAGRPSSEILTDVDAVKAGLGAVVEEVSDVREVAVTNAAAGAMNANPTFAAADPEAPFPAVAPGWADWSWGHDRTVVAGQLSRYALRYVVPVGRITGIMARHEGFRRNPKPGWYVLEAMVTLEAGSLDGAGLLLLQSAGPNTGALVANSIDFRADPDSSGNAVGSGAPGRTYAFSKIVRVENPAVAWFDLFAMSGYVDAFGAISAKTIVWHKALVREATAAEIETGQARGSYPTMSARLSSEFTAIAGEQGVMALRQDLLEARAGTNEFNNADLAQGMTGFRQHWNGSGSSISLGIWENEYLFALKNGGGIQDPGVVVLGSLDFGGGPFGPETNSYGMRAWRVSAGERIGFAFDARDESPAYGHPAARWAVGVRLFNADGTLWGGIPAADFQSQYGQTNWHRVGSVFTVPADGYLTIEAYIHSQGSTSSTAIVSARRWAWARMAPGATQLPAYSAPAGGGQLAKVEETAGAVRTLEGKTKAWAERTVSAGSAEAFVQMKAEDDNGNPVSEINLGAQAIGLWTKVGSLFVPVFRLVGTSAHFAGKVFVGLLKQIAIDPDLPAIIWTKGNARIVIGMLPNDDMIYWFGPNIDPSAMRKSNATEWRDANGAAYYKGGISAGQLQASARTSDQSATVSAQTGRFGSLGGTITIVFSYAAETRVASTSYSPPFPPSYEDVSNDPTAQIRLYRSLNGGAFELVATFAATGQRRSWGINGGDYFEEGQEVVCGGAATFVDPDRNTLDRQYRVEMSGRSFTWLNGAGNYRSQFLNVVCVED